MTQRLTRLAATCLLGVTGLFGNTPPFHPKAIADLALVSLNTTTEEQKARRPEDLNPCKLERLQECNDWSMKDYVLGEELFEIAFPSKPMDHLPHENVIVLVAKGQCSIHIFCAEQHFGSMTRILGHEDAFLKDFNENLELSQQVINATFSTDGNLDCADMIIFDPSSNILYKIRIVRSEQNVYSMTTSFPDGLADEHDRFISSFSLL